MLDAFGGGGGYSLSGGSATAGGDDKVGGGNSSITFGYLPPLPTLTSATPSLPSLPTFGGTTQQGNGMAWLIIAGVAAVGIYLVMKRGK